MGWQQIWPYSPPPLALISVFPKVCKVTMDMSSMDREVLTNFLTHGQGADYAPASGEIVGILKQMTR